MRIWVAVREARLSEDPRRSHKRISSIAAQGRGGQWRCKPQPHLQVGCALPSSAGKQCSR